MLKTLLQYQRSNNQALQIECKMNVQCTATHKDTESSRIAFSMHSNAGRCARDKLYHFYERKQRLSTCIPQTLH